MESDHHFDFHEGKRFWGCTQFYVVFEPLHEKINSKHEVGLVQLFHLSQILGQL